MCTLEQDAPEHTTTAIRANGINNTALQCGPATRAVRQALPGLCIAGARTTVPRASASLLPPSQEGPFLQTCCAPSTLPRQGSRGPRSSQKLPGQSPNRCGSLAAQEDGSCITPPWDFVWPGCCSTKKKTAKNSKNTCMSTDLVDHVRFGVGLLLQSLRTSHRPWHMDGTCTFEWPATTAAP
mmetsp:Transcript_87677/g.146141  ORF Transcript_87677/g.146141 Transcript_87677/m.146141 type:complete len:182 (+) Transcript_87677:2272-2817(+)